MTPAPWLAFAGAALGVAGLLELMPRRRRRERGGRGQRAMGALARLGRGLRRRPPHELARLLAAAGAPGGLGPRDVMAAKAAAAALGAVAGVLWGAVLPGRLGVLAVAAGPVVGFLGPDLWLRHRAAARAVAVRRELPVMLDLLRVTVDAGLPLGAALAAVGERSSGPLADQWRGVGHSVELGVPLSDALAAATRAMPLEEIEALAGAVERAQRHGAPIGAALGAQALQARLARQRRIREGAAKAGPKIQLVVALLLVPSVLLLVAAALVAAFLGDGGSVVVGA